VSANRPTKEQVDAALLWAGNCHRPLSPLETAATTLAAEVRALRELEQRFFASNREIARLEAELHARAKDYVRVCDDRDALSDAARAFCAALELTMLPEAEQRAYERLCAVLAGGTR
jgi:uncharacterized small protein (DUF1192 family)